MFELDIVSYNVMIFGLNYYGFYKEFLCFFKKMLIMYIELLFDEYIVVSVVSSCVCLGEVWLLY